VSRVEAKRFRVKYSYQLSSLLYGIYDLTFLMYLGTIFWDMGIWGLSQIGLLNELVVLVLFVWMGAVALIAIVFSPWFLTQTIRRNSQPGKFFNYNLLALAFLVYRQA